MRGLSRVAEVILATLDAYEPRLKHLHKPMTVSVIDGLLWAVAEELHGGWRLNLAVSSFDPSNNARGES